MRWWQSRPILKIAFVSALLLATAAVWLALAPRLFLSAATPVWLELLSWAGAFGILTGLAVSGLRRSSRLPPPGLEQVTRLQRSILDSAGPIIFATDLRGCFTVFNPSAERTLGYRAEDMLGYPRLEEIFPEGELPRIGRHLAETLPRQGATAIPGVSRALREFVHYVTHFPTSRIRGFEMHFRRKDSSTFPAMVHLSAVLNSAGELAGLLAISTDQSATKRAELALRESQERYRDLFENSSEMIATLSPQGRYLYANPAWQRHFGLSSDEFEGLISFESAFPPETQAEAAVLFRRALNGETVERATLRFHGSQRAFTEVEANLSCRREEGRPVSVRCVFRDVTQERQRERRMAMQLLVNQVVGESSTPEEALPRVLEALGTSLGWDLAGMWRVDEDRQTMRFHAGWCGQNRIWKEFEIDNGTRVLLPGQDLPGTIWSTGSPCWIVDVRETPQFERGATARMGSLITGWGVPVRVENKVIAVVEFFSRRRRTEDREMMATVETVCASLGQFMARSARESQVQALNRQKEHILNSVADGIFGTDQDGTIIFVNPAAAAMLGAEEGEIVGRKVHALVHEDRTDRESCSERCRTLNAFSNPDGAHGQDVFFRRDGNSFPVEFSVNPVVEPGGVAGSVLSFRDISQRYALDRMKDEFISTVSHELRTPLTSIRGALGLLSAGLVGEVNEKAANLLRIAVSNSDRLVRLINDILDLERMQSGRAPLTFRRCLLGEVAQQALDAMTPVAEAAKIRLALESGTAAAEADPDRLLQVMTNLLSNAIKFSPAGSVVTIKIKSGSEGVTVSVVDQGRGIPADKLESIFDRFQQVDASDSRQKGGTGLGLAICRTIVHQHSGRIWAERNTERGATFSVFIPFRHRRDGDAAPLPDRDARDGTILICDHDPVTRRTVAEPLRRHGYRVVEAETADQTMALARELPLEAILLDTSLRGMNGWHTLQLLKGDRTTASVPVVVLSVLAPGERPGLAEGVDGWVQKPLEEEVLLAELARVLHRASEPARVLIVEDDEDLARVILATFERAGIEVHHASTRKRAVELCGSLRPDLLILDLSLPDGDGFNVVDWLRQQRELSSMPLVVYSARDVMDFERRQLELGPTEFLTKARVQPQEVEALVLTMLRRIRDVDDVESQPRAVPRRA